MLYFFSSPSLLVCVSMKDEDVHTHSGWIPLSQTPEDLMEEPSENQRSLTPFYIQNSAQFVFLTFKMFVDL